MNFYTEVVCSVCVPEVYAYHTIYVGIFNKYTYIKILYKYFINYFKYI